ncbi:MAG: hypothetical protein AAF542_17815 [Pseudomonadota bacterium]
MKRESLITFCNSAAGHAFEWGRMDCTLFPAYCLDILRGTNSAAEHAGCWHDQLSAESYSDQNQLTLEDWLLDHGCEPIQASYRQTGDFLMIPIDEPEGWISAAVYLGRRSAVCLREGVRVIPSRAIKPIAVLGLR